MIKKLKDVLANQKKKKQLEEYRQLLKGEPRRRPAAKTSNIGPG